MGLAPATLIVVDTDGTIKQLDSLSSAYPGAADTGLHVLTSSFDDALEHPTTVARQLGADGLSAECRVCPVMEICGGGLSRTATAKGRDSATPRFTAAILRS